MVRRGERAAGSTTLPAFTTFNAVRKLAPQAARLRPQLRLNHDERPPLDGIELFIVLESSEDKQGYLVGEIGLLKLGIHPFSVRPIGTR